jgi:hypothetical protein
MDQLKVVNWPMYIMLHRYTQFISRFKFGINIKCSFLNTFDPKWAADRTIVLLLMCIALFNSSCVGITNAPMVACANNIYTALLDMYGARAWVMHKLCAPYPSYLRETVHTESQSKYVLNALSAKLDEAHQINHSTLSFIRSMNANDVGPLVYAFFDLQ